MKVEVVSKEMITPSSSTPLHLKNYKLSLLDQFAPPSYIRFVLFYNNIPNQQNIQKFKNSLADSLTVYYPLAGKYIKDQSLIHCNDDGALFVEARVKSDMADSDIQLEPLLPAGHDLSETKDEILMAVQATQFSNGISVGICVTHKIIDGAGVSAFIKCWVAHATNKEFDSPTFEASEIWPPMENPTANSRTMSSNNVNGHEGEMVTKKFFFSALDIATVKEKAKGKTIPTRVEAVMALLWQSLISTRKEIRRENWAHLMFLPVNLRPRIVPPLGKTSLGSIIKFITVLATPNGGDHVGIDELAGRIRTALRKVDNEYCRNNELLHGVYLIHEPFKGEILGKSGGVDTERCVVTSWCGFGLYDTDFGWGTPDRVRCEPVVRYKNSALLTDAKHGAGIEVLLTLGLEEMTELQKCSDLAPFLDLHYQ